MNKIAFKPIILAAIAGVGLNFLLNLFSLAIGLNTSFYKSAETIAFSYYGFFGFVLASVIAMFTTGWLAGFLSPHHVSQRWIGALYGFIAWSLLLILTTVLITNMIQFASFHSTFTSDPNMIAVRITNDKPMIAETKDASLKVTSPIYANVQKKEITINASVTFLLFLTGAFSSCLGGYLGYNRSTPVNQ